MTATSEINPEAAARNASVSAWMDEKGWARMPDLFAPGTMLYENNLYKAQREPIEKLPDVETAVRDFNRMIAAEKRVDHDIDIRSLRMAAGGVLLVNDEPYLPEERAFKRLTGIVLPPGGTQYLAASPTSVRKFNFDFWAAHPVNHEETAKLRTRNGGPHKKLWAVTSQSYGKFDANEIADLILKKAKGGAKLTTVYDGYNTQFEVTYLSPIEDPKLVGTGELFRLGHRISTADDGSGAVEMWNTIWRGMCRNFGIIDKSTKGVGGTIHKGSMAQKVEALLDSAHDGLAVWIDAWAEAGKDKIFDGDEDARKKLLKLCEKGYVKAPGVDAQQMFNRVYAAWQKEPAFSRQSLVNAVTRAAHENSWGSPWTVHEVEAQATQFVYNRIAGLN